MGNITLVYSILFYSRIRLFFNQLDTEPWARYLQDPGLRRKYIRENYNVNLFNNRARASLSKVVAKWLPSGCQVVAKWSPSGRQVVAK